MSPPAPADSTDTYTQTRYPLLLVPGAILFDMPVDAWSYWFGIVEALQRGGAQVFVSRLPVGTDINRGAILQEEVATVLALTGADKVNLLGYSQGGHTCRYVAAHMPEHIASVTTIASPHQGSATAAYLLREDNALWGKTIKRQLLRAIEALAARWSVMPHAREDVYAALAALTPAGTADFNTLYPQGLPTTPCGSGAAEHAGVRYYSWGGVGGLTNPLDPTDPLFFLAGLLSKSRSDGLVDLCSSHFGLVIRDDFTANHFDHINQLFGLSAFRGTSPLALFRSHANRLKNAGL